MARILIVDDEQENRDAMKRALGDENPDWEIFAAGDESSGIDIIEAQLAARTPIDIVITDLVLETESGGMEMISRARKLDPLIMCILFTAKEPSLDRYAALDLGAFDVVEKTIRGASAVREINVKARAALGYREYSQRINFLRRYFDPRVFEAIRREPSLLDVNEKLVTICFWDIRGFSSLCEILKKHPRLISGFAKEYSETAAKSIFNHNGLLDKFIGDGVMALFGVLNHKDDGGVRDALDAVNAAREFRDTFPAVLARWMEQWKLYTPHKIEIGLGCGMHTGEALVGNVGTEFRDQFTALGPSVNFASRLEARALSGEILISQSTAERVRKTVHITPAGEIDDIKNITGRFDIFSV
jgi:class 3 adenylate cyclase